MNPIIKNPIIKLIYVPWEPGMGRDHCFLEDVEGMKERSGMAWPWPVPEAPDSQHRINLLSLCSVTGGI